LFLEKYVTVTFEFKSSFSSHMDLKLKLDWIAYKAPAHSTDLRKGYMPLAERCNPSAAAIFVRRSK